MPAEEPRPGPPRRVLVVDDDAISREVVQNLIQAMGLLTDSAADGLEAVARAQSGCHDLVLMDLQMPQLDGLAATRVLRCLSGWAHVPVLALTASADAQERQACLDAGMQAVVIKPVEPAALRLTLAQWLPDAVVGAVRAGDSAWEAVAQDGLPAGLRRLMRAGQVDPAQGLKLAGGQPERFLALLQRFAQEHAADALGLATADAAVARARLHGLRGLAATLGLTAIHAAAVELQWLLTHAGPEAADDAVLQEALAQELQQQCEALVSALDSLPAQGRRS